MQLLLQPGAGQELRHPWADLLCAKAFGAWTQHPVPPPGCSKGSDCSCTLRTRSGLGQNPPTDRKALLKAKVSPPDGVSGLRKRQGRTQVLRAALKLGGVLASPPRGTAL